MNILDNRLLSIAFCGLSFGLLPIASATNLVLNGGFESTTNGAGYLGHDTEAINWVDTGYNFLYLPNTADTTASLQFWGPNNGSNNGLTNSPDGGNFIGDDGAYQVGPTTQTISGMTIGASYDLSFYWAAAQQLGFHGATTEKWDVTIDGNSFSTSVYSLPSHGFSGWMHQTFTFTATSSSSLLSFLAVGTPNGLPPFSLLDGVSLIESTPSVVPEPSTCLAGFFLVGGVALRRYRKQA